jgi:hypothetical protein
MSHRPQFDRLEPRRLFATFTVVNANNAGTGSLRQAITDANATTAADTINFNIAGGGSIKTITLATALPELTTPTTVDGRTQAGYTVTTPKIRLVGPGTATAEGLRVSSDCAVYGLSMVNFSYALVTFGSDVTFANNFLNLEPDGVTRNGANGIYMGGGSGNRIGVSGVGGNVIAFSGTGVHIVGSTSFSMQANLIGTTANGNAYTGSSGNAVFITGASSGAIGVAGDTDARNTVSGVAGTGIWLDGGNVSVVNNTVGANASRSAALGNQFAGVYCSGGTHNVSNGNLIGFNGGNGVEVQGNVTRVQIYNNAIGINGGLGIDLGNDGVTPNDNLDADTGPNGLQNYPTDLTPRILPDGTVRLRGKLNTKPNASAFIDIYGSDVADPTGYGEGNLAFTTTSGSTDASGNLSFDVTLTSNLAQLAMICATAETEGSGSEFSRSIRAFRPGDMDGNGTINNDDIAPFVLALTNTAAYAAAYPGIPIGPFGAGDINDNGAFNNDDIAPFVALLTGGRRHVAPPRFAESAGVAPRVSSFADRVNILASEKKDGIDILCLLYNTP